MGLIQDREADLVYIDRLKEELVKIKTNCQILIDEREVLSKINEELSISNHLKETQIENLKSTIRPSNDYKFAVEMNVSLESKLRSYENTIAALKFQLQQRVEGLYKLGQEAVEKKDIAVQINSFNEENVVNVPSVEEIKSLVEDFNSLLEKYRNCKEKKNMMIKRNEKLIEKIQALSGQVQSDHYMIMHLRGKAKTPGLDCGHVKEMSKSQFDLTYKRKSLNGKS